MKKALALPAEESSSSVTEGSNDYQPTPAKREQIQQKQTELGVTSSELFNKNVTGALDRNKTSDRKAVRLMVPNAAALGHDPSSLPLSRSTVHRMRQKTRREFAEATAMEYNPCCPIVVHWDSEIIPEISGEGKVDCLPVLVSGDGTEKLLGVLKLAAGTRKQEAEAVYSLLKQWRLVDKVEVNRNAVPTEVTKNSLCRRHCVDGIHGHCNAKIAGSVR